jgi:hypothetical protein
MTPRKAGFDKSNPYRPTPKMRYVHENIVFFGGSQSRHLGLVKVQCNQGFLKMHCGPICGLCHPHTSPFCLDEED